MKLCLTHSPRKLDFSRSSRSFLVDRYKGPTRLTDLPQFLDLTTEHLPQWNNNLTIWEIDIHGISVPRLLRYLEKDYTANHAVFASNKLLVCGSTHLEVSNSAYDVEFQITCPWFAGGHTVYTNEVGHIAVSCSGSDAILIFDLLSARLIAQYRMPHHHYGHNYDLTHADDVRLHYIDNDKQRTHLNCCFPISGGYMVTAFIQGAVGVFDFQGQYRELTRGFVGCHGARTRPGLPGYYLSDTCRGQLVEMAWHGIPVRTFQVETDWLHDCLWVKDDLYLFSLSDHNALELWDVRTRTMLWRVDMSAYGQTTLLLSLSED